MQHLERKLSLWPHDEQNWDHHVDQAHAHIFVDKYEARLSRPQYSCGKDHLVSEKMRKVPFLSLSNLGAGEREEIGPMVRTAFTTLNTRFPQA